MNAARRRPYPASVLAWLLPGGRDVLDLGSGAGAFATLAAELGHRVIAVDNDARAAARLASRGLTAVTARAENLPLRNHCVDVVTAAETLHRFAPGLALAEIARVLRPQGLLSVVYTTRDDTVPWVRRLARILRAVDPEAMSGEFGQGSVREVEQSPYFTDLEQRDFRNWVSIDRAGLLAMAERRPAVRALDEDARAALLAEIGGLYDSVARPPEPLSLPFQASCWRARVDHTHLTMPADEDGLSIPL